MSHTVVLALLQNAALLLALVVLFDIATSRQRLPGRRLRQAAVGLAVGVLGIGLILSAYQLRPGIIFDTRSVLLGVCGLFLGPVPTAVAMAVTAAFRWWQGGAAATAGVAVIVASGLTGLLWRHFRGPRLAEASVGEFFGFGLVVHGIMLALMLLLPWENARTVLATISLPVLLIYPMATTALALLLVNRLGREHAAANLVESEARYRAIFENNHAPMLIIDAADGSLLDANPAAARYYGWTREQLQRMKIGEINALPPAQVQAEMEEARSRQDHHFFFRHRRADGSVRDVEVFSGPVLLGGRECLYSIVHDVTERRQAEADLRRALAEAEAMRAQLSRTVGELERTTGVLRLSEEQYRTLFQANPHPMWIHDGETQRILAVNGAAVAQYGYAPEEFSRMTPGDLQPGPDSPASPAEPLSAAGAIAETGICRHRTKGGRLLQVQLASHELTWEGRAARLVLALDVTAREEGRSRLESTRQALLSVIEDHKQVEAALRASEERHRSLVETSFDWIWEVDTRNRYTYASPRVRELLGYAPDEVVGRTPFDFMPKSEAQRLRGVFEQITAARQPITTVENVNRHRDGHLVVLETSGVPVFAADGTWLGYRGMDRDITARRTAEKTLRLRGAALEAAANAIVITDRSGIIEWANPAFVELSGWSLAEAVGRNPRDLIRSGEHDAGFYRAMWETIMAGHVWRGEIVNRRKDGTRTTEDMTVAPVRNEAGEITHFIAVKQDVTRQKALEAQIIQSQRMEAIGTLASGIAHDLNNILAPIMLVTDVVRGRLAEETDRELLAMTQASARRGADIVRQLLTFSRGHAGERSVVQPRHLLKEMLAIMRETFPRGIELHLEAPADLWTVEADPTQLHQVVLNLCVNARDALPEGGRLEVAAANATLAADDPALPPGLAPGNYVILSVRDTGHGIPPEIRPRIFDPFFTTKPRGQGTGLGLSTVLGIVRGHRGTITVDSAPGRGTTFRVYLPSLAGEPGSGPAAPPPEVPPRSARDLLLVVDDEPAVRAALKAALERQGGEVITAENGEEALKLYLARRGEVRLVLSDLMMPVMGGVALIRALRAIDPGIRIIAFSGLIEEEARRELGELGVREIITKPTDIAALLATVDRELHRA